MQVFYLLLLLGVTLGQEPFLGEEYKSGIVPLAEREDMFYWLLRSRRNPEEDPLIIWLTGGCGCSSEVALLYENGGFSVNNDQELALNAYSWSEVSNIVFVDNPVGAGFSAQVDFSHPVRTEETISQDLHAFLSSFLTENPSFLQRDFYIAGESYAGHYIPPFAQRLLEEPLPINFKGIAIGNGWVDPYNQYPFYAEYAWEKGLVSEDLYNEMKEGFIECQKRIDEDANAAATMIFCTELMEKPVGDSSAPNFNSYDVRESCEYPPLCYDFSAADDFLNDPQVQRDLGVEGRSWQNCNYLVYASLLGDWVVNMQPMISSLLEAGLQVLIYSGDMDYACNWRGGEAWTKLVDWWGREQFLEKDYEKWIVDGEVAGELKKVANFMFLRVYESGHMVPMDQPKRALEMLRQLIEGELQTEIAME